MKAKILVNLVLLVVVWWAGFHNWGPLNASALTIALFILMPYPPVTVPVKNSNEEAFQKALNRIASWEEDPNHVDASKLVRLAREMLRQAGMHA